MKKSNNLLYKKTFKIFPHIGRSEIGRYYARDCLSAGTTFAFFHSSRKISFSKHDLKKNSRGLHIDGPHIFLYLDGYFKQELRRQTAAVINYSTLFSKK